jgi:hypothetical protein
VSSGTFLVEHYWPGVTEKRFRATVERVRVAAEQLARDGVRIVFLHSTLVPEDEAAFCVFEASSADEVEQTYRRAEVTFERISAAVSPHVELDMQPTRRNKEER